MKFYDKEIQKIAEKFNAYIYILIIFTFGFLVSSFAYGTEFSNKKIELQEIQEERDYYRGLLQSYEDTGY